MKTITNRVKEIILKQLDVEESMITEDASFIEDLGADSIDSVELIMAFETAFDIDLPLTAAEQLITVQDVIEHIEFALRNK